jgi:hypothetical protein
MHVIGEETAERSMRQPCIFYSKISLLKNSKEITM